MTAPTSVAKGGHNSALVSASWGPILAAGLSRMVNETIPGVPPSPPAAADALHPASGKSRFRSLALSDTGTSGRRWSGPGVGRVDAVNVVISDMPPSFFDADAPILRAFEVVDALGRTLWRAYCPFCKGWHYHGPGFGHRI